MPITCGSGEHQHLERRGLSGNCGCGKQAEEKGEMERGLSSPQQRQMAGGRESFQKRWRIRELLRTGKSALRACCHARPHFLSRKKLLKLVIGRLSLFCPFWGTGVFVTELQSTPVWRLLAVSRLKPTAPAGHDRLILCPARPAVNTGCPAAAPAANKIPPS